MHAHKDLRLAKNYYMITTKWPTAGVYLKVVQMLLFDYEAIRKLGSNNTF